MSTKTLVIHTGGIGDFICALPALQALATKSSLEIVGIPERIALAELAGIATRTHALDNIAFGTVFSTPSETLGRFLAPFQRARVWMEDKDGSIANALRGAGIHDVQCFPGIPPVTWTDSAAQYYAHCTGTDIQLPFSFPVAARPGGADIMIQPGSGGRNKNWGLDNYRHLSRHLEERGHTVSWCLGPAEEDLPRDSRVLPPMPLVDLAAVLAGHRLFIGNDSGIGHLASVLGCTTLSIFGPTNSTIWRPIGPHSHLITGNPWPAVEDLLSAIDNILSA